MNETSVSTRRSFRGGSKLNISTELQNEEIPQQPEPISKMEEFELSIRPLESPQQMISEKENIPTVDDENTMKDTEIIKNIPTEVSKEKSEELNNNNNDLVDIDQCLRENPFATVHGYALSAQKEEFKPDSDGDSAVGSLASEEKFEGEKYKMGYKPGVIVWAAFSQFSWYPCIIIEDQHNNGGNKAKDAIRMKYFNYQGMIGAIRIHNIFLFGSIDDFLKEMDNRMLKRSKVQKFVPTVLRAIEEAKIFMEFDESKRLEIFEIVLRLQTGSKAKRVIEVDINDERNLVPAHLRELVQYYIDSMKVYDKFAEEREKELKAIRESKPIKDDKQEVAKESKWMEKSAGRQSERVCVKRKLSIESSTSNESSQFDKVPQPVPKKRRVSLMQDVANNQPLTELFKLTPKDIPLLFKNASFPTICMECCEFEDEENKVYQCSGCPNNYHEKCSPQSNVSIVTMRHMTGDSDTTIEKKSVELKCKACFTEDKLCSICNETIADENKIFCNLTDCKKSYHLACLQNCSQSSYKYPALKNTCPQHDCHTCLSKRINLNSPIVKCIKCPAAYHTDICCLPAGTQVISKNQIICPRHKIGNEIKKPTPINLDYCCKCLKIGKLICCDNCPMTIHAECLPPNSNPNPDSYICDDCEHGVLPLYNTIVWAKVGVYRWWPAFVLTPQASEKVEYYKHFERQFCIRFFGSYDYYWVTSDRVFPYSNQNGNSQPSKNKSKRLEMSFTKALKEADETLDHLEYMREEMINSKPKPYRKINQNQPIPPVKFKRDLANEVCTCKPDDASPCGIGSDCIVRHLHYECNKNCPSGVKCQNQKLRNKEYANIELRRSGKCGYGAFAKEDIPAHTLVIEYIGDLIDKAELDRRIAAKKGDKDFYFMAIDGDLFIDAEPSGNLSRFINHSCDPNCEIDKIIVDGNTRMAIISKKIIEAGTELTFNYQFEYTLDDTPKLPCFCNTSKCTGFIDGTVKKEEVVENRKILKTKKKRKANNALAGTLTKQKVPKKSPLEINEADPLEKMMNNFGDSLPEEPLEREDQQLQQQQ